jgi:hypothetical protein
LTEFFFQSGAEGINRFIFPLLVHVLSLSVNLSPVTGNSPASPQVRLARSPA